MHGRRVGSLPVPVREPVRRRRNVTGLGAARAFRKDGHAGTVRGPMSAGGHSGDGEGHGGEGEALARGLIERLRLRDPREGGIDPRVHAAWRSWLSALSKDAEAAIAAAMAFGSLAPEARDAWLDALDADAQDLDVPRIALYAPLLAVEADASRRLRMMEAMATGEPPTMRATEALRGETADGDLVCVVMHPLYLDFVEMLVCRYRPDEGIVSAQHDPMRHVQDAPRVAGNGFEGVELEQAPLRQVIEELAHAVVADRREGRDAPAVLARFSHLFGPDLPPKAASTP